jgi:hypothetical protein
MSPSVFDRRSFLSGSLAVLGSTVLPGGRGAASAAAGGPPRVSAGDLDFASALAAAHAIRRGEVSSVELTTRMLDRIKQHNPRLNAIVTLTEDAALARARPTRPGRGGNGGVPSTVCRARSRTRSKRRG